MPHTKQSFHQTRGASSCHTIYSAWAMQMNAGPKQRRLILSWRQSYSRTSGACMQECLYYMQECVSSCQTRTIMWPDTRDCLCQTMECSSHTQKLSFNAAGNACARTGGACHRQSNYSTKVKHPRATQQGVLVADKGVLVPSTAISLIAWGHYIPGQGSQARGNAYATCRNACYRQK